ncbi:MAG: UDP-3-O-[3-hydroxymyristoyl] glucosamine N-acyltransferase [Pseudomonadales bacterium]|jgi:UDP-3-O-[3-hydroxymyristoyl] glucosamine N-acyltransferase
MPKFTLSELAATLGCEIEGNGDTVITSLGTVENAKAGQICFIANKQYVKYLATTSACAAIVSPQLLEQCRVPALITSDPYGTYAKLSLLFDDAPQLISGISPQATISASASVDESASVAANAVIESGAVIGPGVVISAGCYIGENSTVASNSKLFPNVSVYHNVRIGSDCLLHSGVVVGADGFGFAPTASGWQRFAQVGSVVIGDRVSIGANTTVDRGAIEDTVIGNDVIIDNQVQIGHNVIIGDKTAIAGASAIAGSTKIGQRCVIAGGVGIVGHIEIVDEVTITARTLVTKSITEKGSYSSGTPMMPTRDWRKAASVFKRLRSLLSRVDALEKKDKREKS